MNLLSVLMAYLIDFYSSVFHHQDQTIRQMLKSRILRMLLLAGFVIIPLIAHAKRKKDYSSRVELLNSNSEKMLESDADEALRYAKEALYLSSNFTNKNQIARSYTNLGEAYSVLREYAKSIKYYTESILIYHELGDRQAIANACNKTGLNQLHQGTLSDAIISFERALTMYERLEINDGVANCLNSIGLFYQQQNKHDTAINHFQRALSINSNSGNSALLAQNLFHIGNSQIHLSNYEKARGFLQNSITVHRNIGDQRGEAKALGKIGLVELLRGNLSKAEELFSLSLHLSNLSGDKENSINSWIDLGIKDILTEDHKNSRIKFDSSLFLALKFNLMEIMLNKFDDLSAVHAINTNEINNVFKVYSLIASQIIEKQKIQSAMEEENKQLKINKEIQKLYVYVVFFFPGFLIIPLILIRTQFKHEAAIEHTLSEQENLRYKSVIEASEQERKRISRDLHDSINHMLSTAKLNMSGLEDDIVKYPDLNKVLLDNSIQLIDEAVDEVRNISHNLMPGSLTKLGLIPAVKDLFSRIDECLQLKINFDYTGIKLRYDEITEIALFRIIQESLNNIIKHSCATKANIFIEQYDKSLNILISDNGIGFDTKIIGKSSGIGWKNIYARAQMIGARVQIESTPGECTQIRVQYIL